MNIDIFEIDKEKWIHLASKKAVKSSLCVGN